MQVPYLARRHRVITYDGPGNGRSERVTGPNRYSSHAYAVFVGRPARHVKRFRTDPEAEFRRLLEQAGSDLAERVGGGVRISGLRGTTGLPGVVRRPRGLGWAMVGDAGYIKDAISAHGIKAALRDAELYAQASASMRIISDAVRQELTYSLAGLDVG